MAKKTKEEKEIIQLINNSKTIKETAEILSIKESTVRVVVSRLKLKYNKQKQGGKNIIDLTGKKFGSLLVIDKCENKPIYNSSAYWNCLCDCGKKCIKLGRGLRYGKVITCGCRKYAPSIKNGWKGHGFISKTKWSKILKNALIRKYEVLVTIEECNEIYIKQNKKCYLSGLPISFEDNTASLDRIDNSKGYIKNNVAWCHKDINIMKHSKSREYFIELCKTVANNNEL